MNTNSTVSRLKRFISGLPRGQPFSTREVIGIGTRSSIDTGLHRLVEKGILLRLARGVFMRDQVGNELPSVEEMARLKAQSFNKKIFTSGIRAAEKLGLVDGVSKEATFITTGCSSSFVYLAKGKRIHFRSASERKTALGDSFEALVIRALWFLGSDRARTEHVFDATVHPSPRVYGKLAHFMPDWMAKLFPWYGQCVNEKVLPGYKWGPTQPVVLKPLEKCTKEVWKSLSFLESSKHEKNREAMERLFNCSCSSCSKLPPGATQNTSIP